MDLSVINLSAIITAIGVLVALTNVITQVLKKATMDKMPTNIVAIGVAILLTLATGIAFCQIYSIQLTWYLIVGIVVLGFMVAYAAMFGFDKLMEIMKWKKE